MRILKLWRHIEKATQKSLNTKFIDNPLIFPTNLVTTWSGTQNDDYGRHKTACQHIAVGGRWKFHVHATDQHHLTRGAITQIRWALHHATKMTWYVAIIESAKKTLTRLLALTSNLTWLRVAVRNHKIGIVTTGMCLRADYQCERRLSGFQWFIKEHQPVNGLRVMIFGRWWGCWKLYFCSDSSVEREINSEAVQLGFFPWDEYQKLGELSYPSIGYLFSLIHLTV
jgi:hypothetical protein